MMSAVRNFLTITLAAALLSGCAAFGWLPWVDSGPEPAGPVPLEPIDARVEFEREWRARIGSGLGAKEIELSPVILADRIYAADAYGHVEARDRFDGERLWQTSVGEPDGPGFFGRLFTLSRRDSSFLSGLSAGEGLVVVGTMQAELIALSVADGEERWRRDVSSEVLAPPTASNGMVFVQTQDGRLAGYDASDGSERWVYDTQLPVLTLRGTSRPIVAGGGVFAGFSNGMVGVYREQSGEPIWEHRVSLPRGRTEMERMVDVDSSVLPSGAYVFVGGYQGRVKALRPQDGSVVWEREDSTHRDLAEGSGYVFMVDGEGAVKAIDRASGDLRWEQRGLLRRGLSSPVAVGDEYLIVTDEEGYLHLLEQRDGSFAGRYRVDRRGVRSPVAVAGEVIYALGNRGRLVALSYAPR